MDHKLEERRDLALAAFRGFDVDGDGMISSQEVERVMEDCGPRLNDVLRGDGELDFEEFMKLLRSG